MRKQTQDRCTECGEEIVVRASFRHWRSGETVYPVRGPAIAFCPTPGCPGPEWLRKAA